MIIREIKTKSILSKTGIPIQIMWLILMLVAVMSVFFATHVL